MELRVTNTNSKGNFLENNDYLVPFASEVTHARPLNHCKLEAICYRTFRNILLDTRET